MASVGKFAGVMFGRCNLSYSFRRIFSPRFNFSMPCYSTDTFKFNEIHIETATTAQKHKKPDASELSFETFSDHLLQVDWNHISGWNVPRIVPMHHFQFHPGSTIFHNSQAIFEGMKAFKRHDGSVALFRPELHVERFLASTERASLPPFDGEEFLRCLKKLVSVDSEWVPNFDSSALYIRPTFIGNQNSLGILPSKSALLYIITCPVGSYFSSEQKAAISLLADPAFVRAWPGGVGDKKMGSNYTPAFYIRKRAEELGLDDALWLFGENHQVTEAGAMNVFFVFQKGSGELELATPPLDGTILPGITRLSILELAEQFNEIEVSERAITMSEIISAVENDALLEMFACGTDVCVCPIDKIKYLRECINIPTMNRENPWYQRFYNSLSDIQYGRVESKWSVKVE